jgi:hypothetical protein
MRRRHTSPCTSVREGYSVNPPLKIVKTKLSVARSAACVPYNERKGDRGGWILQPSTHEEWTGLIECYRPLVQRGGVERAYNWNWFRALDL